MGAAQKMEQYRAKDSWIDNKAYGEATYPFGEQSLGRGLFAKAFVAVFVLFLVGCASPIKRLDETKTQSVDYPAIGQKTTTGLGERLVAKGVRTTGDAIEILKPTQFNKGEGESSILTCAGTVAPRSVFKSGTYESPSRRATCYGPVTFHITLADGGTNWNCPGRMGVGDICKDEDGAWFLAVLSGQIELKQDYDHIREVRKLVEHEENFVQELLYNGRVGDHLKFIYREFTHNVARPAFTQEVQYDLSESSIVGFKSLRLKVIQASNTQITYELIRSF